MLMNLNKNILSGQALLERLDKENWQDIIPKLHYYSLNKLDRFNFLYELYDVNNLATQIADEAIKLVWEEQRKWNTNYYANLYPLLKGIVDSLISNFINSKEVEITEALPEYDLDKISECVSNPESDFIISEIEMEIANILKDDVDAQEVFDCLKDGLKPREICTELNWEISKVYNSIKRVQRKLKEHYNITKNGKTKEKLK
jgi:hypothetical protein